MLGFDLTEEQLRMKEMAHEFAEKEIRPVAPEYDEKEEFPWSVMCKAADVGLLGYQIPDEYGGAGVTSHLTDCIVSEELFWGCAGTATSMGAIMLGALPILIAGNEAQKKKYLTMLTGRRKNGNPMLGAYALTEPEAGSDAASIKTSSRKVDGGYIINGTKHFITNGGIADVYVVFATQDPGKGADGIDAYIVEGGYDGVKPGKKEKKMGIRASHTAQVHFEDVFVPAENRLGEEGEGFFIAMQTFDHSRPVIATGAVGVARAAFDFALAYAQERKQFGRPIAKQQVIQFMLADMATEIDAARLLCWRAAWLLDQGEPNNKEASMAKQYAADMCMKVTTDAVQIVGGMGYMRDYPVEKFMRDAKIMQIYEGTSQIQKLIVSRFLIGFG
ncbi:MAG: acyl-CoA dehydrogenase family protein [Chloroflexi bacterium]|nr:acyl-CoA dehydrogenase family protein [Chloroflexota bacterium]